MHCVWRVACDEVFAVAGGMSQPVRDCNSTATAAESCPRQQSARMLLPLQKSNYRVSNLPLKYDFRRLPKSTNSAGLFIRAELRWADSPGLQARYQKRITVAPEKIVLIPMPCFPGCR